MDKFSWQMLGFLKRNKNKGFDKEIEKLVKSINDSLSSPNLDNIKKLDQFKEISQLDLTTKKVLILRLLKFSHYLRDLQLRKKIRYTNNEHVFYGVHISMSIVNELLRKKLSYNEDEWIELLSLFETINNNLSSYQPSYFQLSDLPITTAIKQLEYYLKENELSENLLDFIRRILNWKEFEYPSKKRYWGSDMKKSKAKLESIACIEEEFIYRAQDIELEVNKIIARINQNKAAYIDLFKILMHVSGAKPTKKNAQQFDELIGIIGNEQYRKTLHSLLEIPSNLNPSDTYPESPESYIIDYYLSYDSKIFIKGLAWTAARFSDKTTIQLLSKIVEKSYTKIPGKGPAAAALGNAGIYALGNMRGKDGLGALSRLKLKVRQNNVKKVIDKFMLEGAKKYKVSVEELKEMAVPEFQLINGNKHYTFEDYILSISIVQSKVKQQWIKPDGSFMKSVPSLVKNKEQHKKKLQKIRKEIKEIQKVYSAQKQRLDNQFILDRTWGFPSFQKYYLNHGLVSPIAKKLIWTFRKNDKIVDAIYQNDVWQTVDGEVIDWLDKNTSVNIWHPVFKGEGEILKWREKIMELEWKQPIKQAFREIYILTPAEINTRTYSNRMAAHILKQHQFNSLASLRNWKYSLMGAYDDGRDNEICCRALPEYNMNVEFWIDEVSQGEAFNDTGIWYYVATDQVKFLDNDDEEIELVNVPKIVFSEIMRDVDLFVGVSSVGNDPQWIDNNGTRQDHHNYWRRYAFGNLTEIAKTRKSILTRLLPRLTKIKNKTKIEGKFLIVNGQLRTYKIHIGSGNILMEPNDQYLCIVPARSENITQKLFIPFEGDRGLSIVLSKAFLLAEDDKIDDASITSQIRIN